MYRETQNASTRTTPGGHAARRALWLTAGSIALIWMWSQRGHAHASEIDGDSEWRTRLADLVENHPFVAIGAAGAVGAAAAFTLPVSAAEDRWMGAARDTVVDQAHSRSWEALRAIVHAAAPAVSRVVPW